MIALNLDRAPATRRPRYEVGQIVRHRRYGYRGVVVAVDRRCEASEDWYQSNNTQPPRRQAWYHVLVHETEHSTYAAEENLADLQPIEEVWHPWLPLFFDGFSAGRYVRNNEPWPVK